MRTDQMSHNKFLLKDFEYEKLIESKKRKRENQINMPKNKLIKFRKIIFCIVSISIHF